MGLHKTSPRRTRVNTPWYDVSCAIKHIESLTDYEFPAKNTEGWKERCECLLHDLEALYEEICPISMPVANGRPNYKDDLLRHLSVIRERLEDVYIEMHIYIVRSDILKASDPVLRRKGIYSVEAERLCQQCLKNINELSILSMGDSSSLATLDPEVAPTQVSVGVPVVAPVKRTKAVEIVPYAGYKASQPLLKSVPAQVDSNPSVAWPMPEVTPEFSSQSIPIEEGSLVHSVCLPVDSDLIVIGDVHGDRIALEAALSYIHSEYAQAPVTPSVVFLGDLIDRGPDSAGCLLRALEFIAGDPQHRFLIPGNHELAISFDESSGCFESSVNPAEFLEDLNATDTGDRELWKTIFESIQRLPRAILFSNGLFALHAGLPHEDVVGEITSYGDLSVENQSHSGVQAVTDLTWLRVHERAPKKVPNRATKSCEIGLNQIEAAAKHLSSLHPDHSIRGVVRGHDHFSNRFSDHNAKNDAVKILTVNTMGDVGDLSMTGDQKPCIALYRSDASVEVVKFV